MRGDKWLRTGERVTVENASQKLAASNGSPVFIQWHTADRSEKGGGWSPHYYDMELILLGTTAKSVRVQEYYRRSVVKTLRPVNMHYIIPKSDEATGGSQ